MTTETTNIQTASINRYTGYPHNRYDGYQSSRGLLNAFGGTPTADCFADEDDQPDEEFNAKFNGELPIDPTDVLYSLDCDEDTLAQISSISIGESYVHTEYWGGNYEYQIRFSNQSGVIIAETDILSGTPDRFVCRF